jgi:Flp pilus assembly protein TadD/energy-coupling factor transporter ATP-binding protein EcfA2
MSSQTGATSHHHYNPDWLSDDALVGSFVARQAEFTFLRDELARIPLSGSPQHYLLVGVRGAGKTTLLKRLAVAIRQEAELANHLIALSFPEELYQIKDLADFWWACCEALADELDRLHKTSQADEVLAQVEQSKKALSASKNLAERNEAGFALLQSTCSALKLRPVLLVDNLDMVFQRIDKSGRKLKNPHATAYWALREQLSTTTAPIVIGGSVRLSEPFTGYDKAFYDFFIPKRLSKLGVAEVRQVLERLADAQGAPEVKARLNERRSRLDTLYDLTGGNPRAIGLIFQLLRQSPSGRAVEDFERLMDITTPYYKARFEDLPEQAQVVMHALAVRRPGDAAGSSLRFGHTAAELATHTGLATTSVSAQLDSMDKEGLIEKSSNHGRTQYRIAEQLFRLWLQMRGSRRIRQNVLGLTAFLEAMFSAEELSASLSDPSKAAPLSEARYAMAVADADHAQHIRGGMQARGVDNVMQHIEANGGEFEQYIGNDDLSADLSALITLRQKLKKCKIQDLSDAEQEALIGSVDLKLTQKEHYVKLVCESGSATNALAQVRDHLARERQDLLHYGMKDADIKPFFHARSLALLPLPFLTPPDVVAAMPMAVDTKAFNAMIWRIVGLRHRIKFKDEAAASAWLEWGKTNTRSATSTDMANVAGGMRLSGCLNSARQALDSAFSKGESARAWFDMAALNVANKGDLRLAEDQYRKAIELDPRDTMPWNNLGNLLKAAKRIDEAENAYRKAIELDPVYAMPWRNLGNLLRDTKRIDEAESAYRKAIELDPVNVMPWRNLGNLLREAKRLDEAETVYRNAIEMDSNVAVYWNNLGYVLKDKKRLDEAESACRKAIELNSFDATPWNTLGNVLSDAKRLDEAESAYRRAIELDTAYAMPWNNLGNALVEKKRLDEAERAYRKAIELSPVYAMPWNNLGTLMGQVNRLDEAVIALKTARNLDDNWHPYWLSKLVDVQTQICTQKALRSLEEGQEAVLRDLLLGLQNDSPDLSAAFASTHFVEAFLAPVLKQGQHAELVLGLLREMNAEKFARPLLIAFEAALSKRPEMLVEQEPELQRAAQHMFDRLTAKPLTQAGPPAV